MNLIKLTKKVVGIVTTLVFLLIFFNKNVSAQTFYCSFSNGDCNVDISVTHCDGLAGWVTDPSLCDQYDDDVYSGSGDNMDLCLETASEGNGFPCINTNPPEEPGDGSRWCIMITSAPCQACPDDNIGGFATQEDCENARTNRVSTFSCDNPNEGCVADPNGSLSQADCFNVCTPACGAEGQACCQGGLCRSDLNLYCGAQNTCVQETVPEETPASPNLPDDTSDSITELNILCNDNTGINTGIGCVPINNVVAMAGFMIIWSIGIGSGIAFLLMLYAGYMMATSSGEPRRLQAAKELFVSAMAGLIMMVFSVFILRIVGFDILGVF